MVENQILIAELHIIKKLLYDLYEGIDEHYTETLENNDELAIACADAELQLIKKIIDKMEDNMTRYLININNDCNQCMECVEVCQNKVLTEAFINMVKITLKDKHHYFRKYVQECTYCESCEAICEQHAIWIVNPELEELT